MKWSNMMENKVRDDFQISGKYKHFKGNYYDLFCIVYDWKEEKYVLYQQGYGDKSFWIRPYDMFFDQVTLEDGKQVPRFSSTGGKRQKAANKIKALLEMIEAQTIVIHHTETEEEYIITAIDEEQNFVAVHSISSVNMSGYLTDFELMRRLGYIACRINGQTKFYKLKHKLNDSQKLTIGRNDIALLSQQINPCSIDLQIADSGYICTKLRLVDPQSVEIISTPEHLWKPVRTHKSKQGSRDYFMLYPGKTVLTHTKEKIRIPDDCAAKIEIKSTFARLSIDITSGDFCNPGYYGYYPLEITNKGKHTIILHQSETMAQLMLIPLQGPILENYHEKATFKDKDGFDDGTPYSFWRERAIKSLKKAEGTQKIIDLYYETRDNINSDNASDVNATRERFDESFLSFCQKRIMKPKYKRNDGLPDEKKLFLAYCQDEKIKKTILSFKWLTGLGAIVSFLSPISKFILQKTQPDIKNTIATIIQSIPFWSYLILFFISLGVTIFLLVYFPRVFCTFEKMDVEKLCEQAENRQKALVVSANPDDE